MSTTSLPTRSIISEPSMSRLIYTLLENALPLVKFVSCTFPLRPSMLTSSPKVCRHQSSTSLGSVLMFAMLPAPTAGECWNVIGLMGLSTMTPHMPYIYIWSLLPVCH
jgi:hypothetical protein